MQPPPPLNETGILLHTLRKSVDCGCISLPSQSHTPQRCTIKDNDPQIKLVRGLFLLNKKKAYVQQCVHQGAGAPGGLASSPPPPF